jgi:hypothetical protein
MITSSGAEGINLLNTRYVHLLEPYWHSVRNQQVIGRARRFRSHIQLPPELRTVDVFSYISVFTEEQVKNQKSNLDEVETTDQIIMGISNTKLLINQQLLGIIKETSINCELNNRLDEKNREKCFSTNLENEFSFVPKFNEMLALDDLRNNKTKKKEKKDEEARKAKKLEEAKKAKRLEEEMIKKYNEEKMRKYDEQTKQKKKKMLFEDDEEDGNGNICMIQ